MIFAKRVALVAITAALCIIYFQLKNRDYSSTLQSLSQSVGLGELVDDGQEDTRPPVNKQQHSQPTQPQAPSNGITTSFTGLHLPPSTFRPPNSTYTRAVIMGHLTIENTTFLSLAPPDIQQYIYIVDDLSAPLHTPMNKGHEAMVYLTYILDHYDSLPDINIFMHAHQRAWHTPELLNHEATEVLKRLSSERVWREGYMNLRCHWDPGCPERIYPGRSYRENTKAEEVAVARAWAEMFPGVSIPDALGAPCCAQFAVSSDRITNIPRENFERYRNWLIRTKESDWVSGRVFEYIWQVIFTGEPKVCPDSRACYCDGYGICFTTHEAFEEWFGLHHRWGDAMKELDEWEQKAKIIDQVKDWTKIEQKKVEIPVPGKNWELKEEIDRSLQTLIDMRVEAIRNGTDPEVRASVAGRSWKLGDGY
ncbi:hypothetical protein H2198_001719 [Neophaeococcomyces mojaviensis]|uniref:Uncharacterized protein n=1 Tax=Neophaeococcomyces mojaviensis TaxID=3383035 RepID=A0ACC3AFZ7_9EURO|nr:hypothetical protein H2198_001719 [Knufia sp. JES_112]